MGAIGLACDAAGRVGGAEEGERVINSRLVRERERGPVRSHVSGKCTAYVHVDIRSVEVIDCTFVAR